jgi:hypothetical protein
VDPATAKAAAQIAATLGRSRAVRYLLVAVILLAITTNLVLIFGPWMLTNELAATLRARQLGVTDGGSCGAPATPVDSSAKSAAGFTAEQVGNAKVIWRVGREMGVGDRGTVVGLATAMVESRLRNLSYGDRDSVGLFQQRAGWGSMSTRMNPTKSARLFYAALKRVHGWRGMSVTRAAQAVQHSAFPSAYAAWEQPATRLTALFQSKATPGTAPAAAALGGALCSSAGAASCPATGLGVEAGLKPDTLRVLRCVRQRWPQLTSFGGVGPRPARFDRDHQEGRAVDLMIPDYRTDAGKQLGFTISRWVVANHARLGVKYVIWNAHIWNVQRASEGWRACGSSSASCYSGPDDTAAHRDHVHVSVFGNQAAGVGTTGPTGPIVKPVDHYVLTARFGQCSSHWAHCHTGLDFAASTGTPIRAIMSGTVIWTRWGGAYGNLTKIQHPNGVQSWYAHQSSRKVHMGEVVTAGEIIGRVGSTGNTTGPHLHLEIRVRGTPVDPDRWLSARGVAP